MIEYEIQYIHSELNTPPSVVLINEIVMYCMYWCMDNERMCVYITCIYIALEHVLMLIIIMTVAG